MIPDHFKTLEVHPDASKEVIEKAYKVLASKYHPDRNPPEKREWATVKMRELNLAYGVLGDEKKRQEYLQLRRMAKLELFYEEGFFGLVKDWIKTK